MKKTLKHLGAFFTLALLVFAITSCSNPAGGGGDNVLQIGNTSVSFNNTGGNWGHITLRGSVNSTGSPTITGDSVSITSTANISGGISEGGFYLTGSANLTIAGGTLSLGTGGTNGGINHNSTGLLTISGGVVASSRTNGTIRLQHADSKMIMSGGTVRHNLNGATAIAINVVSDDENAVIISGGTIGSMTGEHGGTITELPGMAIRSTGTGGITIRGNALITSSSVSNGTIRLQHATGGTLRIEGDTVRNQNSSGNSVGLAISVNGGDNSRVIITGGTVTPTFP